MEPRKLNALIFGATGAVGRVLITLKKELVKALAVNSKWQKIVCVVRKELQEWAPLKDRVHIIKVDNLDSLSDVQKWKFPDIDTVFCCLGTRVKQGQAVFVKVDKTYPLWIADIANHSHIRHYSLVSSTGSNPNSWFLYPRTKGEVQRDIKTKSLPMLSIFKPGLLKNRYDARFAEIVGEWVPFVPKIDVKDVAQVLIKEAEMVAADSSKSGVVVYENSDMLGLLKGGNDKCC